MNVSPFLPPPVRLSQAPDGDVPQSGPGTEITRRSFLKRTGGATVATMVAWNVASRQTACAETGGCGASGSELGNGWSIELTGVNPGDGANAATTGQKSKYGWNWKSALVAINGSDHLLVVRWKCTPNPKHPANLVSVRKNNWNFDIQVLAQVRSNPTASYGTISPPFEDYMVYEDKLYKNLVADAGWSLAAGSNGTVALQETLASRYLNSGQEIRECVVSHNPVDDFEAFYRTDTEQHRLVMAVRSAPPDGDQAGNHSYRASVVAGVIKEALPVVPSGFKIAFTPPASITIEINVAAPPTSGTTVKLGEVATTMGLGFTARNEPPTV